MKKTGKTIMGEHCTNSNKEACPAPRHYASLADPLNRTSLTSQKCLGHERLAPLVHKELAKLDEDGKHFSSHDML